MNKIDRSPEGLVRMALDFIRSSLGSFDKASKDCKYYVPEDGCRYTIVKNGGVGIVHRCKWDNCKL